MAVDPAVLADLQARAAQVRFRSGHDVQVIVSQVQDSVTLTIDGTVVSGPDPWDDVAAHDLDLALGAMADGTLLIAIDEDGLPSVVSSEELPPG